MHRSFPQDRDRSRTPGLMVEQLEARQLLNGLSLRSLIYTVPPRPLPALIAVIPTPGPSAENPWVAITKAAASSLPLSKEASDPEVSLQVSLSTENSGTRATVSVAGVPSTGSGFPSYGPTSQKPPRDNGPPVAGGVIGRNDGGSNPEGGTGKSGAGSGESPSAIVSNNAPQIHVNDVTSTAPGPENGTQAGNGSGTVIDIPSGVSGTFRLDTLWASGTNAGLAQGALGQQPQADQRDLWSPSSRSDLDSGSAARIVADNLFAAAFPWENSPRGTETSNSAVPVPSDREQLDLVPPAADLVSSVLPANLTALDVAVQQYFSQLEQLVTDLSGLFSRMGWAPWVAASVVLAMAGELARRWLRPGARELPLAARGEGTLPLWWFPDLDGPETKE